MDLFEPNSGSQVHDLNCGVLASGLFWTLPLDDDALDVSDDGRRVVLDVEDIQVIENYRLFGPNSTPATLSYHIEWDATGPLRRSRQGRHGRRPPTPPRSSPSSRWQDPQRPSKVPDNPGGNGLGPSANQDSQPVVEPNGSLHVSYVEEECNTAMDHHLHIRNSSDGGSTFGPDIQIDKPGQFVDNPDASDLLPNKNFRAPIAPSLNFNVATKTLAFMYQNNVDRATSGADISVQTSTDGGNSWSNARFVSVGPDGKPAQNDQFFSWVTSDTAGTFHAIWLDNREDPGNKLIDTWQATSTDDGKTSANSKLSTVQWNPDLGFFTSGAFIGDYQGAAAGKSVFYPVWVDGRNTAIASTGIGNTDIFTNVP